MATLKLFVLGETSGIPSDWGRWGRRAFVLAESVEQALSLHDGFSHAAEVTSDEPVVLCHDEPATEI